MFEQEKIKAVIKKPNEIGDIVVIENTNEAYKEIIGAEHLDYALYRNDLSDNPIDIIVDDFGIKKNLDINFKLNNNFIFGTVIFVERDSKGYFIDLSDDNLEYLHSKGII